METKHLPTTIEQLLGFNPPESVPLPEGVTVQFIDAVKGKTFGKDGAALLSRYGSTDYEDHPLQWLKFSADGKSLSSFCLGPDGSDASVAGSFRLKEVDAENNYVIELQHGCKTTFSLKGIAINVEETVDDPSAHLSPSSSATVTTPYLPMLVTCQQNRCPQRHRTKFLNGFSDFDELSGGRTIGDPGVVQLKRCARCKQVHYCSVACQRADWRERHRVECDNFGRFPPPNIDIASADTTELKAVLMHICQSCITSGEERSWSPEGVDQAKEVGRRLYAIGGKDLCISVCDGLRNELANDTIRRSDAKMLEIVWCAPVVPGWWP